MPYINVTNLPTKASGEKIYGKATQSGFRIEDEHGYEVVSIHDHPEKKYVAEEIATALEKARDIGFEQGLASIRAALGVNNR